MSRAPLFPWRRPLAWLALDVWPPLMWRLEPFYRLAAKAWRRRLGGTTFVAVTGSLGKTTAKELIAATLATAASTAKSQRNQNAGVRVASNLLAVRRHHRFAVFELSGGQPGALARAAPLVAPRIGVLLNVAETHTMHFASREAHAEEKAVLLEALPQEGVAVLNVDDPLVAALAPRARCRIFRVGRAPDLDLSALAVSGRYPERLSFRARYADGEELPVRTQLIGEHWLPSVLAGLAVAELLGAERARAAAAIGTVAPIVGRLSPVLLPSGAVALRDDYNASFDGTRPALAALGEAQADRRLFVFTDISDTRSNRKSRLKLLAPLVAGAADAAVLVGESAEYGRRRFVEAGLAAEAVHAFATLAEGAEFLRRELRAGDLALFKGRTTDHAERFFLAQLGELACWKSYCPKRILCDDCWELGLSADELGRARPLPPP